MIIKRSAGGVSDLTGWLQNTYNDVKGYLGQNPNARNALIGTGIGALGGGVMNYLRDGSFLHGALGGGVLGAGAGAGFNHVANWAQSLMPRAKGQIEQQFGPQQPRPAPLKPEAPSRDLFKLPTKPQPSPAPLQPFGVPPAAV